MAQEIDEYVAINRGDNKPIEVIRVDTTKLEQLENDYDEVKVNLQELSSQTEATIKDLTTFAKSAQHHLVYQALAQMIKSQNETNKELGQILKRKEDLLVQSAKLASSAASQQTPQNVTNNNLFVTTTEAIDMIKRKRGIEVEDDGDTEE